MSRYKKVPLDQLVVDDAYQRVLDEARVERIAEEFDPALLGTLEVSTRNGKAAVFDGQHRLAALRRRGASTAPCLVHDGLTVAEEAALFVALQTQRKPLRPLDRFKARLVAGDPDAIDIKAVVEQHGYTVGEGGDHPHSIGAVTALDRAYARGGADLLDQALTLLGTWRDEPRGTDGALIEGLAIAAEKFGSHPRWVNVAAALEQITATSLLRKAMAMMETGGGSSSRPWAVARQVGLLVGIRGPYKKPGTKAAS